MPTRVDPIQLIHEICAAVGGEPLRAKLGGDAQSQQLREWIEHRDTPALYDWLMARFAYQGISDAVAEGYIEEHGNVTYDDIQRASQGHTCGCAKLRSFEAYQACYYRKLDRQCNGRRWIKSCPVPRHDLRNGTLNQLAYSCFLFIRDVCHGDLVQFIDTTLQTADRFGHPDRLALMRSALLSPLSRIYGAGLKVLAIAFADLLMAGADRARWFEVGSSIVAIDSLIHNLLHRTGILQRWHFEHAYGPSCYGSHGCALVVDKLARAIDARRYAAEFPCYFPRFIEHCLWAFSAGQQLGICNGNAIDDTRRCDQRECPAYRKCGRIPLRLAPKPH